LELKGNKSIIMRKQILLTIVILMLSFRMQAQNGFTIHLKTGYGFNPEMDLNNQTVRKSRGLTIDFGSTYKAFIFKKWYAEIGLGGRTIFSSGKLGELSFEAQTLRALMIANVGFEISDKWEVFTGLVLQNNKDFTEISFMEKYFWRLNQTVGARYVIAPKWNLTSNWSFDLRNLPDPFLVNDPKFLVQIGIEKQL